MIHCFYNIQHNKYEIVWPEKRRFEEENEGIPHTHVTKQ
jgi:hypothetical protein